MERYSEPKSNSFSPRAKANDSVVPWRLYVGLFYLGVGLIIYFVFHKI